MFYIFTFSPLCIINKDEFAVLRGWTAPRPSLHPLFAQFSFRKYLFLFSFGPEIFYFCYNFWDFLQSVNSAELSEWTSVWCRTLIGNKWCACLGCFGSRSVTHASLNPTYIAVHFVHVCHQSACSSLSASSSSGMFAEASPILGWQLSGQQDGPNDPNGIQTAPFLLWKIISSWRSLMLEWN